MNKRITVIKNPNNHIIQYSFKNLKTIKAILIEYTDERIAIWHRKSNQQTNTVPIFIQIDNIGDHTPTQILNMITDSFVEIIQYHIDNNLTADLFQRLLLLNSMNDSGSLKKKIFFILNSKTEIDNACKFINFLDHFGFCDTKSVFENFYSNTWRLKQDEDNFEDNFEDWGYFDFDVIGDFRAQELKRLVTIKTIIKNSQILIFNDVDEFSLKIKTFLAFIFNVNSSYKLFTSNNSYINYPGLHSRFFNPSAFKSEKEIQERVLKIANKHFNNKYKQMKREYLLDELLK